jgi:NTP pyrophosphatase (non-canonical NTP hydrolase)
MENEVTAEQFFAWVAKRWEGRTDDKSLAIMTLGLCGEAGEVSEPIKKYIRGSGPVDVADLRLELGDVFHYWCAIAKFHGITLESILDANVKKLEAREAQKKIMENAHKRDFAELTGVS